MAHSEIISKLPTSFDEAKKSGDLLFFPSTVHKHIQDDVEYEIRVCPALQKKPTQPTTGDQTSAGQEKKAFDPFAYPYNEKLHVGDLKDEESGDEYGVLLNKFSVVPHHFLLVTKEFKSQASPPMPSDLVQAYLLLSAAKKAGQKLFAFYNCGKHSGASQAHKHIQFIPVPDGEDAPPFERLAKKAQIQFPDRAFSLTQLSFANHCFRFPQDTASYSLPDLESFLASSFLKILDLAISTIRHDPDYPVGPPSYNLILTLEHIHIIPRSKDDYILPSGDKLGVNALGFSGMLLVKSEEEFEAVKQEGVSTILRDVALKSVHDIQVEGSSQCSAPGLAE